MVVMYHIYVRMFGGLEPLHNFFLAGFLRQGYIGVPFFMLLSGFILAWNYDRVFAVSVRGVDVCKFIAARIARLYPVFAVVLIVNFVKILLNSDVTVWKEVIPNLILNLSMLSGILFIDITRYLGVSWSVSVEMVFYAMFPFIMWILYRLVRPTPMKLLGIVIGAWLLQIMTGWLVHDHGESVDFLYFSYEGRLVEFIAGTCLGLLFVQRAMARNEHAVEPKITHLKRFAFTFAETAALGTVAATYVISRHIPIAYSKLGLYLPCMAIVVMVFAFGSGWLSWLLSSSICVWLGESSYSLYLWHNLVIGLSYQLLGLTAFGAFVAIVGSVVVAGASYQLIEIPARRRLRRRMNAWIDRRLDGNSESAQPALATS